MSSTVTGIEVKLDYEEVGKDAKKYYPTGYRPIEFSFDPPPGDWKLPESNSNKALYAMVKIGDRERLLMLDCQSKEDRFYNKLYFDENGNGSFSEDETSQGTDRRPVGASWRCRHSGTKSAIFRFRLRR